MALLLRNIVMARWTMERLNYYATLYDKQVVCDNIL